MNYFEVNLPSPSEKLLTMIRELVKLQPSTNPDCYRPALEAAGPTVNAAECMYFCTQEIHDQTALELKNYINDEFAVCVLILRNHKQNELAHYPPHQDMFRMTTLNYVIDCGGDQVETWSYDKVGSYDDLTGELIGYGNADVHRKYKLNDPKWYALDVVRYHSVENISHDRLLLTLSFTKLKLDDLYEKYQHLVTTIL